MIPLLCGAQWKTNSFQLFETSSSFFNSFLIDYKKKKIWLHQHTCDEPKRLSRDLSIEFPTQKFNGYTTKQHITYLLIELSNYSIESSMLGIFFSPLAELKAHGNAVGVFQPLFSQLTQKIVSF